MSVALADGAGVHVTSIKIKVDDSVSHNNNTSKSSANNGLTDQTQPAPDDQQNNSNAAATAKNEIRSIDDPVPADSLWTTQRDGAVKLRMSNSGPGADKPQTIVTLIKNTVRKIPDNVAIAVKRDGDWIKWTYSQYMADIRRAAKSFIKLGLEPYKGVGIIGFNSPEWFIADLGCVFAGGLATGIYTTNSAEACHFVAENCQANIIVVENNQQLQKILKVKDRLPHLKAIVQYIGEVAVREDNVFSWSEFLQKGNDVPDEVLDERINALAPNRCCLLIYTSGTTGTPKGVMLSHDNITYTTKALQTLCARHAKLTFGDASYVSYLPLSHIAAQLLDIFVSTAFGATVYFAQPDALKGSLQATLKEVRPHVMVGVPRVWEKIQEALQNISHGVTGLKKRLAEWAKGVGLRANYALMNGESLPLTFGLADMLFFKRVRVALGLDRCQLRLSAAAPITKDTLDYFMSLNLPLCEVYGMSECTGPHTSAFPLMNRITSVGKELPGVHTALASMDSDGNGEIVMDGRHVFMGYLNEEEKTKEVLDDDGRLHSGDIGRKDKDGFVFITGRIKELIITAGGENIPPVAIEDAVKEALPVVSQCMLIGDKKKFLSMLLTLKVEVDPDTMEPTNNLTRLAQEWMKTIGSNATTLAEILEPGDAVVLQAIQKGIDFVNRNATSNAQKIQKWTLLPKDFSIPGGELGPTMKMRRPIIVKMYTKTINAFYEDPSAK